jgi:hypothetical protein
MREVIISFFINFSEKKGYYSPKKGKLGCEKKKT